MNYETARKFLIAQTITTEENPDSLLMHMHQGKPPVPGQITSILLALKVVFAELQNAIAMDKELACALYMLSVKTQQLFVAGRKAGVNWPPIFKEDLLRIAIAVESIFSGEWKSL
ncbi:MAG: Dethiobiotin synthetase [Calothrix sp. MO_167.B42]|nr:Dethiobiotin synthetase [Calothrix sp. MO_167.B42]